MRLAPPPPSTQPVCPMRLKVEGFRRVVRPPALTTLGEALGQITPGPSPDEAKYTTFFAVKQESSRLAQPVEPFSPANSPPPQLMETSPLPVLPEGHVPRTPVLGLISVFPHCTRLLATSTP